MSTRGSRPPRLKPLMKPLRGRGKPSNGLREETEKEIQNSILEYLAYRKDVFAWPNQSVGIFDPVRKVFRKSHSKHHLNGVSDILGIYRGKPLAIEVKTKIGKVSPDQRDFLHQFGEEGGVCFVARSVQDVTDHLG